MRNSERIKQDSMDQDEAAISFDYSTIIEINRLDGAIMECHARMAQMEFRHREEIARLKRRITRLKSK